MDDKWSALEKYNLWNGNSYKLGLLRTSYINKIHAFVGNKLVKVLVGQRRSGKSYILRQIASGLISDLGVHPNNILYINKEYLEFDFIDNYQELEKLYQLYREKLNPQGKVYLFFDEIQNVDGWERFVNSHSQDFVEECELFISGSNSRMLSSELATLLSGRYVEFHIFHIIIWNIFKWRIRWEDVPLIYLIYNVEGYRNYIICLILNLRSNMLLLSKIPYYCVI